MGTESAADARSSESGESMRELIEEVAKALVDSPDGVSVHEVRGATTTVYEVSVPKPDVGKLIGKNGRTLKAFRTIVGAVATKLKRKAILEIIE